MLYLCKGCEDYDPDFEGASAPQILRGMMERRLIFMVGKGGAGKTTISAALGLAAANAGKKTLVAEVGDSNSLGTMFGRETLPPGPEPLAPGLWGVRLNPRDELEGYIHYHVNVPYVAGKITNSTLFENILDATPGLKEVMTLGQIWRLEKGFNDKGVKGIDIIIIDAPATGHGLSLLKVPQTLVDMINVGPIAKQIGNVKSLLSDHNKTWLAVASLPEELPVNEALEFMAVAKNELGMHALVTFVNCVYTGLFDEEERAKVEALGKKIDKEIGHESDPGLSALITTARKRIRRRDLQRSYVSTLKENVCGILMELPFFYTNEITRNEIEEIAWLIMEYGEFGESVSKNAGIHT